MYQCNTVSMVRWGVAENWAEAGGHVTCAEWTSHKNGAGMSEGRDGPASEAR